MQLATQFGGTTCSRSLAYNSGHVHSVSPATSGDYHWSCRRGANCNSQGARQQCRAQPSLWIPALATDEYVVTHECGSYSFAPTRLREDLYWWMDQAWHQAALDTKQLDKIAKFDSSARNFHSIRGVHLVTLHLRAAQHRFVFDGLRSSLLSKNHQLTSSVYSEIGVNITFVLGCKAAYHWHIVGSL